MKLLKIIQKSSLWKYSPHTYFFDIEIQVIFMRNCVGYFSIDQQESMATSTRDYQFSGLIMQPQLLKMVSKIVYFN